MKLLNKLLGAMATTAVVLAAPVKADEVVLNAVTAFQPGTFIEAPFSNFVEKVNEEGKGLVQINVIGGPDAIPPFEVGNAVSTGVIDLGFATSAFYTGMLPEGDAMKLSELTIQELRENGGWDYINKLHNDKMNVWYLARTGDGTPFHLYTNKPVEKADLKGFTLRVTPIYRSFFEALGANSVQTPPSEVYTSLERGVVDGYGWPIQGIFDLGWHEVTKARVDPGFYTSDVAILMNLDKWNSLSDEQRDFLTKMAVWVESTNAENARINEEEAKRQADAGMEVYTLEGEEREKWLENAKEAGWAQVIKTSPEHGPRLRELMTRD
ncbi:MAG TPA: TRAP transporter substrate-binding protein DctP [Burkholderiaceae bacterium]|nr:TRAP transporter substrate-binding protein DctP [Burkholderiaceae bacterium]